MREAAAGSTSRELMTISPTQLIASVTTMAIATVKSVSLRFVAIPREEASCGCTAVSTSWFDPNTHSSTTASKTSASSPISPGVTERISPIR